MKTIYLLNSRPNANIKGKKKDTDVWSQMDSRPVDIQEAIDCQLKPEIG